MAVPSFPEIPESFLEPGPKRLLGHSNLHGPIVGYMFPRRMAIPIYMPEDVAEPFPGCSVLFSR